MNVEKEEYANMAKKASPNSPIWKDMALAFVSGGIICTIGQGIMNLYLSMGIGQKEARTWVSVTLIFLGILLTVLKIYNKIAKHAGAGTLVPITGFANSVVSPAIEFKSEGQVLGLGAKMFTIAGPVIVFGTISSVIYGIIVWIFKLY
jgi:stage V sporulation protein AC